MLNFHEQIKFSEYRDLYDKLIPQNHMLRKINEMVDFRFVYDALVKQYCLDNGREAEDPVRMFKYLLLKVLYEMSDRDLVERCLFDMSFKYFLDIRPEDGVIDDTSLSKFRKLRFPEEGMLDLLIKKSVQIALDKGVISEKSTIIIDSTHTRSSFNHYTPVEILRQQSKKLRKAVYAIDESKKAEFPAKVASDSIDENIEYCKKLLEVINGDEMLREIPTVKERANYLDEIIEDNLEHLKQSKDEEAAVGHKSADTSFFGTKTHIAMTEEGIITAATVTSGEAADGNQLKTLVEKSRDAGVDVEIVVSDGAYSTKENLDYAKENLESGEKNFDLISKISMMVAQGNRKEDETFEYNKDAKMFVCKAGHMAISKVRRHNKQDFRHENPRMVYYFDIEKCKHCSMRNGCYKDGVKTKSYSVSITSDIQKEQMEYEKSERFKKKYSIRYKIEAKNSQLKNRHGYGIATYTGLRGMEIQGATTLFVVNLKKILTMMEIKSKV